MEQPLTEKCLHFLVTPIFLVLVLPLLDVFLVFTEFLGMVGGTMHQGLFP